MVRTELHFHLLPGVDDGPCDDAEAIALARLAVADGTSRVVVTPHVKLLELDELLARTAQLQARLREAGVELELRPGGELSPDDVRALGQADLELLAQGPPDQPWLLLEAPLLRSETDLASAAEELRERGFGVLIGHPERSAGTPAAIVREQVDAGAILQINASSVTGRHGPDPRRRALALARSGLPFVLASDAHSPARPPQLTPAAIALEAEGVDRATVTAAVDVLPEALLTRGLAAAGARHASARGTAKRRSRVGQGERAGAPVSRSAQVFLDRRRGF
jgi:protein-tyrosine phosphatase